MLTWKSFLFTFVLFLLNCLTYLWEHFLSVLYWNCIRICWCWVSREGDAGLSILFPLWLLLNYLHSSFLQKISEKMGGNENFINSDHTHKHTDTRSDSAWYSFKAELATHKFWFLFINAALSNKILQMTVNIYGKQRWLKYKYKINLPYNVDWK